jgi:hypothetical protein
LRGVHGQFHHHFGAPLEGEEVNMESLNKKDKTVHKVLNYDP